MAHIVPREPDIGQEAVVLIGQGRDIAPMLDRLVKLHRVQPEKAEEGVGLLRQPLAAVVGMGDFMSIFAVQSK